MSKARIKLPEVVTQTEPPVGKFLRHLRNKFGLTQEFMAKKIGISRPTLNKIEAGKADISLLQAKKLADFYNLPLNDLLKGQDNQQEQLRRKLREDTSDIALKQELQTIPVNSGFRLNLEQEVIIYMCSKLMGEPSFYEKELKQALFLLDTAGLKALGYPFPGVQYQKSVNGPEPLNWENTINDLISSGRLTKFIPPTLKYPFVKLLPLNDARTEIFKGNELQLIDEIILTTARQNQKELSGLIEQVPAYQDAEVFTEILMN